MIFDDATFVKFQAMLDTSVSKCPSPAKSATVLVQNADSPQWSPALMRHSYSQTSLSSNRNSVLKEMLLDEMCIHFAKGDITQECGDYLVNIASSNPRLLDTDLQGTFLKKGGRVLQEAYMSAVKEKGNPTKTRIIETAGPVGGLRCKVVGHICAPDEHKELKGTIKCVLEQAEKARSQTVVIPLVLKAGRKEFTVDKVAKYCYKGVASFIKNPHGFLTKVVFIHPEEQLSHQFFLAFQKASKETNVLPKMRPLQAIKRWTSRQRSSDDATAFKRHTFARHSMYSNLSLNVDEDSPAVLITAYASTETVAKMVTKEVKYFVDTEFKAVTLDDPDVHQLKLRPHAIEKLIKEAERKHVKLTIKDRTVVLQGHKRDTEQLKNSVQRELGQIRSLRHKLDVENAEQQRYQEELRTRQVQAEKAKVESQKEEAERGRQQAEAEHAQTSQELEQIKIHGKNPT